MDIHRTAVVHISILTPPAALIAYLGDVESWTAWAPWVRSVERSAGRRWRVDTDAGSMTFQFVEANSFGVLDHDVVPASGDTVRNSMRVLANGTGSELVMVLFKSPAASDEQFSRDVQAVTDDLARIKKAAEALTDPSGAEAPDRYGGPVRDVP